MTDWKTRLAIISDETADSFAEAVEFCLPLGIRAYEVRKLDGERFPQVADAAIESVLATVQANDLTLVGVSPGFFKGTVTEAQAETELRDGLPKAFRLMERLGVRQMTVFSFKREGGRDVPIPDSVIDRLQQAAERCQREGIDMIVENSAGSWGDTGANLALLARTLNVRVVWDPGNAAASGETAWPDGYQHVRDRVAHVHFKNWTDQDGNVAINDGVVDMAGQVAALQADDYAGYYCIEPHQWHDSENATRRNTAQLLALLQADQN